MCSTMAGGTPCLHPHGHKGQRSVHSPALHHGGDAAKSVCSHSRGKVPISSPWIVYFYFLQLLFSLLNNSLFIPHIIQALKNLASPLTLYLLQSYFIYLCKGKFWWGLDCVLATCIAVAGVTPLPQEPCQPIDNLPRLLLHCCQCKPGQGWR
jgi:hypothetical protein